MTKSKQPEKICKDCGKPIEQSQLVILDLSKHNAKNMYWHKECENNSENHIRKNESYDDFLNRTTNP